MMAAGTAGCWVTGAEVDDKIGNDAVVTDDTDGTDTTATGSTGSTADTSDSGKAR